ncbi:MAG: helix-turn-helix domain-containing protein [Clostridiales bacterium]|nr:helix-turn-helix domain-containing protein [Clostridiales bacterium]
MRKNILSSDQILNFEFQIDRVEPTHFHQSIEILYILEGSPEVTIHDSVYRAQPEDILVINANKRHSYISREDVLIGCFEINFRMLCEMLNTNQILFWCNSVKNKNAAYDEMREVFRQIFNHYAYRETGGKLVLQSLYYKLLQILVKNFLVRSDDRRFAEEQDLDENRIAEIVNYVNANYQRKISLSELADHLYLSVPYLSKYIKKNLGMNFLDYVNNIRIFHAVDDLLYTAAPITSVAMENGFASTAAFNAAMKKVFNLTPSEYRASMHVEKEDAGEAVEENAIVKKRVNDYLDNQMLSDSVEGEREDEYLIVDVNRRSEYAPYWRRMINVGRAGDLLRSDIQEQVLLMKRELGFTYVRIWGIFGADLFLNETDRDGKYHFDMMDKVFDFLTRNQIRPYLELGYKPREIHSTLTKNILRENEEFSFSGMEDYTRFISDFAVHLVNRYGIEEVENWYFELWGGDDENTGKPRDYFFDTFNVLYRTLKKHSSDIRVGGGGVGIQYGRENFLQFIRRWEKQRQRPDFITLYCYPYIRGDEDGVAYGRQSSDRDFLKNQLEMVESVLEDSALAGTEIHVSEWSSTLSNRNVLNDSCYKASHIVKNVIDCFGKASVLGYWVGTDIFSEYTDTHQLFFGGCGLLNTRGIKKPAYYAYRFLSRQGKYMLCADKSSMVTTNGNNNYSIVCHNYRHLNYRYYLSPEDSLNPGKLSLLYEDNQSREMNFQLKNVKNGRYKVKTYSVSPEHGSAQEEWQKIGAVGVLNQQEVEYLIRISTPHIQIRECEVKQNVLNFETVLKAQEIQLIHITYLYE